MFWPWVTRCPCKRWPLPSLAPKGKSQMVTFLIRAPNFYNPSPFCHHHHHHPLRPLQSTSYSSLLLCQTLWPVPLPAFLYLSGKAPSQVVEDMRSTVLLLAVFGAALAAAASPASSPTDIGLSIYIPPSNEKCQQSVGFSPGITDSHGPGAHTNNPVDSVEYITDDEDDSIADTRSVSDYVAALHSYGAQKPSGTILSSGQPMAFDTSGR